ncbi:hypothetical protein V1478_000403 [Vespula squamosa]|uniref:Uncharacterized protein n=1 Tax=Vespula squamosa TaxID=30214 RepID=A0ABD2C5D7_VESSQ
MTVRTSEDIIHVLCQKIDSLQRKRCSKQLCLIQRPVESASRCAMTNEDDEDDEDDDDERVGKVIMEKLKNQSHGQTHVDSSTMIFQGRSWRKPESRFTSPEGNKLKPCKHSLLYILVP